MSRYKALMYAKKYREVKSLLRIVQPMMEVARPQEIVFKTGQTWRWDRDMKRFKDGVAKANIWGRRGEK